MSAQGAKKRMGSRRQLKHKSPDVDELQFKETTVQECGGSTESAEDVLELSKNRKKLGSRRKNNRQHHAKDLGVSDGAARNTTEDDQLGTTRMSLTDEVKVTHQVPEESHRHSELKRQRYERDQNNEMFMNIESEDTEMSCAAEIRTDLAPGEEVEFSCSQVEGAVQTFDLTEMCDKELNMKPVETEDNPRNEGLQEVTQPVSQSNLEHREAEASSAGTEETLEPTHLFVATGTVEKESELMCEDEFVLCEAPEGLLSGSPSQDQNPKPRHPEPDPQPLIPKNETPPEDLDDREADSRVELCDNSEEDDGGLDKPGPEVKGFSSSENVAKVNTEDQIESAEMHNITVSPESVSCDAEPGSSPHQQHVHPATTDQSEALDTGNKESDAVDQDCEVDDQIEDDVKSSSDQLHQEHKDLLSEMEQSCSSQALHSETDSCSDPQPQTSDLNISLLGNRRKLGSSRRQKGRQRAVGPGPGSYKLPEAAITNSSDEETVETRKISITLETEVRGGVDENPGDGAFAFLAAKQQKDQSESTEASQEVPDRSSNTRNKTDEDAETLRIEGSYFLNESHMKWKETKCSGAAEITSESQTDAERSTEETQPGDTDGGCLHTFDVTEVDGEKETMTQEKHERENSNEALQSDAGCCLSSEAQDGFIKNDEESDTNMKPVETEDNPRNEGLQEVTQPVSQSNLEHREAEASSAGTEETLEPTHLFVATGTVEKESELMCEDEFVLCEAPEGLLSGSPSQDQNPKPRHPEPDPQPLIPKNETPPEDLDDREADSRVELCDNSEEDDGGLDKPGPEVKGFSSSENVAKVNTEDQIESAEMHNITVSPESVSCDAEPGSSPHQQHVHPATTDQSEALDTGNKESDAVDQDCEVDDQIEDDVKSSSDQLHQEHKDLLSEMEQSCSSQALHSETDSCSDPQPQTSDLNISLLGNRRKLGSSRRQKGRQRAVDPGPGSYKLPEAAITNSSGEETVETRKISITLETEVRGGVDENPGDGAFAFLAAKQQKDLSESTEASQEVPDRSSNTRNKTDEDAETLRIEGSYFLNESHMKWKETKCSGAAEITSESQTDAERSTEETQLGDTDGGCLHTFDVTEVDGEKETMTQEKHERENSNEALQSDAGCCLSSEAQDGFIKNDEESDTNMKPVETEDNPRNEGLQEVTQPVSQSNLEHREAEASSAGTEETLEPTHLFVATGTVEKESELMCEDEFVLCEAPEGLLSGSPSQDQNPKPRHPEPDPQPLIPKNETPPEDLDDREADSRVELCDNSEEDDGGLDKPGPEVKGFSSSENVAKVNTEDQIESAEMHNITVSPESVSCDAEPGSSPHQQHVHPATTDQSEALDTGNKESDAVDQDCEVDDQIEDDVKSSSDQLHQEHKDLLSEMEQSCSSQALHSETDSCSDPQPQTSDLNISLLGNRRKLGSSRREKGRQRAVDPGPGSYKLPEAAITNSSDEETVETRKISITLETEVRGGVDENPGDGAFAFLAAKQQKDQSESTEASQEVPDRSSNTRNKTDEDAETLRIEGSYFLNESHMKWKETKCSGAAEITSESQTDAERSTEETQLGDTDGGCLHTFDVTEVDGEKETMTQEKHERENSNEALQSDAGCCLSSEAQDGFIKNDEESDTNMKPVETEDNPRNEGLQEVTQPVSQSNLEHREAEASSAGTEETLEPTHLFVATGTVEKESELMCEDEFVLCEAPEGLLSGSPSQDQNPKPRHPEPDPQPLIPKNETPPEDLDDREADSRVELCDNSEEDDGGLDKPGPEVKGFSSSENVAKVNTEDQIESAEMHNITVSPESVSCDAEPGSSPHQQHVHPATTDQSEALDTGNKESDAVDQDCEVDDQIEDDVKSSSDQLHQEHKDLLSEMEQSCSSQALHSETDSCSDPQPQTSDLNISLLGNRRKLGSSRRQKGRQRAVDPGPGSYKLPEAAITNSSDEETVETRKISITLETEVRGGVDENPGDGAFAFLAAKQQKDQSESTEASQEVPDRSSNTRNKTDEDAETLRIEGSYFLNESHMKWKETKCSGAAEITSESQTDAERSTEETQLGDTDGGCLHTFDVTEVDGEKETMTQEKHERENSNEALQSDAGCCLSSEAQDGFIKNDEESDTNMKPVETEDNPRNEGLQEVTQPVSQSNLEHREAEASSAGTEETLEPTHLFVATGTVEKESELMCEDEFVLCEAPEGLLSGSPSQDQNPKPRHPEPDPQPLIPKNETPPEDLDDREADSRVELCDNSEEDDGGLDKPGPEVKGFSSSENVAKVNTEDQIESAEMHNITVSPESVSCDAEPGSSPHQQHVHPATTDQSEALDTGNKESDAVDQDCEVDDQIEDDVKSSSDQLHQEHKDLLSEMEQSCSSQALHSETDSCSDPQPQTSDLNISLLGNRRKLGSSRRQKGRQRAVGPGPGSYKLPEAAITNSSDEETVETRKISITLETEVRGGVDENPGDGAFAFLAAKQQKDQSESTEASQEVPDRSSNTRNKTDEDAETLRIEGSYFLNESHMKWKETKCSGAAEITSESQTDAERSTEETQLGDTDGGCLHTFDVTEVDGEKETMTQEKHERENSNEALQSDAGCCLSSEAQDGFIKNDEESDTNMKPVETEDNPRNEGLQEVTQPVSQSNLEHREAEASSAGTEETLEPTHLFVATGTVEKESELMCEDEFVLCEAPEGLLSGSLSQDQNPKPRHPEPDPQPLIPKNETPPEDLDEAMTLKQEMEEMSSNDCVLPFVPQPEDGITLDSDLQEDVATAEDLVLNPIGNRRKLASSRRHKGRQHVKDTRKETFNEPKEETTETTTDEVVVELITASATMRTNASYKFQPETEPELHPAQNPGVREDKSFQEDIDLSQNVKDNDQIVTGSDSDIQRMTFEENSAGALVTLEGFTQEAPHLVQKDEDSIGNVHVRHTNDPKETGGHPGGEESADGQQELVQSSDTSTQQDPEISCSSEPTNAKDTSSDPSSLLCFQETISDDPAMEASAGHEPKSHLDDRLHSQEKSKQTRRKMGSTRWTHKKQEDEHVHRAETSELRDNTQAGGGRFEVSLDKNTVSSVEPPQEEADITSDLQRTHSTLISHTDGLTACVAGQSASDSQGVFNPTINVQGADLWDGDGNIDVNVEPSQLDGFTAPEAHTAGCLVNPSQRSPIGDAINTRSFESNLVGEESVNSITEIQQPETITSEVGGRAEDPGKVAEGGCIKHLEPADTGSDLNTGGRRRKMGSMRRNLNSGRKEEDVRQQQKVDNEQADEVSEDSVSEHSQEAAKDPRPLEPAPHPTSEEDPADQSAHQPVTSPDSDLMSGTLLSGRRRKLGSHRMSSKPPNQEAQTGGDDKLSEVDDNEKESSTNISSSTPGRHSNPVSDLGSAPRTPVESPPGRRLSQDSRSSISLAGSSGDGGVNSNSYNVVMVGNSSVGKTSFMRRVQNGRFSSDLPSSVGLDTCPWPVTADGRRVVLQLWDTAGQERFHSITRQIFHKAHAFLLMYDITSSWSFTAVSYWANCIQEEAAENVTILLLGNKSDCAERQVPTQKGEILAKEYNFEFMECSVATGQNVNESLQTLARILSNKVKLGEETTALHKEPQQKKSSGCC
ncbi:uncharacterized protein rab44 isoform X3 [Takifugu rubripes]|nr:uncharacterized protein LOC101077437 isoform X3 [Takifugu rubripes]